MQVIDGEAYLNIDEAVALLGVKKATIYAYVSRGVLRSFRQGVGRQRLYRRSEIEALLALREDTASAAPAAHSPAATRNSAADDRTARDVDLPGAETWVGEH